MSAQLTSREYDPTGVLILFLLLQAISLSGPSVLNSVLPGIFSIAPDRTALLGAGAITFFEAIGSFIAIACWSPFLKHIDRYRLILGAFLFCGFLSIAVSAAFAFVFDLRLVYIAASLYAVFFTVAGLANGLVIYDLAALSSVTRVSRLTVMVTSAVQALTPIVASRTLDGFGPSLGFLLYALLMFSAALLAKLMSENALVSARAKERNLDAPGMQKLAWTPEIKLLLFVIASEGLIVSGFVATLVNRIVAAGWTPSQIGNASTIVYAGLLASASVFRVPRSNFSRWLWFGLSASLFPAAIRFGFSAVLPEDFMLNYILMFLFGVFMGINSVLTNVIRINTIGERQAALFQRDIMVVSGIVTIIGAGTTVAAYKNFHAESVFMALGGISVLLFFTMAAAINKNGFFKDGR